MGIDRMGLEALAILALSLSGCNRREVHTSAAAEPRPVAVETVAVRPQALTATVAVTGTLVSNARVDVKAETTGRLLKFPKREGDRVEAGEAVAWVDQENYNLAIRQAESTMQVAEAGLERVRVLMAHSQSELERARNLMQSGGITDKDLKSAEINERDARAQVALSEAQLGQAKAALDAARKRLRDTAIRAPVSGEIQHRFVNPGAYLEPPTAVFTLVDNSRLELESPVATAELAPIRAGQPVRFTVNSWPGAEFAGRVIEVSPAVDAESRSAKVRIRVENPGGRLKAGMFAQGEILTGTTAEAIVIPIAALYRDDRSASSPYVFLIEDGRAAKRPVRIAREFESTVHIADGLKAGDLLIAEQRIEIAEGVRVERAK